MIFNEDEKCTAPNAVARESVIVVEFTRGLGIVGSPVRRVVQYWLEDGTMLAERDPQREG